MNRLTAILTAAFLVVVLTISVLAHEFQGTVVSVTATALKVTVIDETSKKPATMTFELNRDTKIYRGTKAVTFAAAKILKGEKITVMIDHDGDQSLATVLKLAAARAK